MVALWVASQYPERVISATYANTAARIGTQETWETRIEAVSMGGMGAVRDAVLARFLSENFRQRYPRETQQIGEMIEQTNPEGYIKACACLRDTDLRQKLSAIHVPSLILAGELDESTPVWQARELHAAITGSELVIIREAAHLSNREKPEDFNQALLTFLERIKPS
jgi:pimeloyl-ACP methyl ester carboxylesterase